MGDLGGLREQLAALLQDAATRHAEDQSARAREMREFESRRRRFDQIAGAWTSELVAPRLQTLADALPASGSVERFHGGRGARATFEWSEDFPISASLTVSIVPDGPCEHGCVHVEPQLIPMLAGHPSPASREVDLETTDTRPLAQFLDQEIVTFADHYLRVREPGSVYQRHVLVRDPVCGMTIHPSDVVETHTHSGHRFHFCSPSCAERFRLDPDGYLRAGHSAERSTP